MNQIYADFVASALQQQQYGTGTLPTGISPAAGLLGVPSSSAQQRSNNPWNTPAPSATTPRLMMGPGGGRLPLPVNSTDRLTPFLYAPTPVAPPPPRFTGVPPPVGFSVRPPPPPGGFLPTTTGVGSRSGQPSVQDVIAASRGGGSSVKNNASKNNAASSGMARSLANFQSGNFQDINAPSTSRGTTSSAAVFQKENWDKNAAETVARMSPSTTDRVAEQIAGFLKLPQNEKLTKKILALLAEDGVVADSKPGGDIRSGQQQPESGGGIRSGSPPENGPPGVKQSSPHVLQQNINAEDDHRYWISPDNSFFSIHSKNHEYHVGRCPDNAVYYSVRNAKAAYEAIYGEWNPTLFRRMQDKFDTSLENLRKMHDVLTDSKVPLLRQLKDLHAEEGDLFKRLHSVFIKELLGHVLMSPNGTKVIPYFQLYEYGSIEIEDESPVFEVRRHLDSPPPDAGKLVLGIAAPRRKPEVEFVTRNFQRGNMLPKSTQNLGISTPETQVLQSPAREREPGTVSKADEVMEQEIPKPTSNLDSSAPEKQVVKSSENRVLKSPEKQVVKNPEKQVVKSPEKQVVKSPEKQVFKSPAQESTSLDLPLTVPKVHEVIDLADESNSQEEEKREAKSASSTVNLTAAARLEQLVARAESEAKPAAAEVSVPTIPTPQKSGSPAHENQPPTAAVSKQAQNDLVPPSTSEATSATANGSKPESNGTEIGLDPAPVSTGPEILKSTTTTDATSTVGDQSERESTNPSVITELTNQQTKEAPSTTTTCITVAETPSQSEKQPDPTRSNEPIPPQTLSSSDAPSATKSGSVEVEVSPSPPKADPQKTGAPASPLFRYPPLHMCTPASIGPPKPFGVSYLPKHALWNRMAEQPLARGSTMVDLGEAAKTAVYAGQRVLGFKVTRAVSRETLAATRVEATVGHQTFVGEGANDAGAFVNLLVSVFDKTKVLQLLMFHDLASAIGSAEDADWVHFLEFKCTETRGHLINFVSSVLSNSSPTGEKTFVKGVLAFSRANSNFACAVTDVKLLNDGEGNNGSDGKVCRMVFYSHSFWAEGPTEDVAVYRALQKACRQDKSVNQPVLGQFKRLFKGWSVHPDLINEMMGQAVQSFDWKDEIQPFLMSAFNSTGKSGVGFQIVSEQPKLTVQLTVSGKTAMGQSSQSDQDVVFALMKAAADLYVMNERMGCEVRTSLIEIGAKFLHCDKIGPAALAQALVDRAEIFEDSPLSKWLAKGGPDLHGKLSRKNVGTDQNPLLLPFLALECGNLNLTEEQIESFAKTEVVVGKVVNLSEMSITLLEKTNEATDGSARELYYYWMHILRKERVSMRFILTYVKLFFTHGLPFAAKWHSVEMHEMIQKISGKGAEKSKSFHGFFEMIFKIMTDFCEKYFNLVDNTIKTWVDRLSENELVVKTSLLSGNEEVLTMEKLQNFKGKKSFVAFFLHQVNMEPEAYLVDLYLTESWLFDDFARCLTVDAGWATEISEGLEPLINDALSSPGGTKLESYLLSQAGTVERLAKYFVNELKDQFSKMARCSPLEFLFRMPSAEENFINLCFMEVETCSAFLLAYRSAGQTLDPTVKAIRSFIRKFLFISYSYVMDRSPEELADEVVKLHKIEVRSQRSGLPFLRLQNSGSEQDQVQTLLKIGQKYSGLLQSLKIILSHRKAASALGTVVNDIGTLFCGELSRVRAAAAAASKAAASKAAAAAAIKAAAKRKSPPAEETPPAKMCKQERPDDSFLEPQPDRNSRGSDKWLSEDFATVSGRPSEDISGPARRPSHEPVPEEGHIPIVTIGTPGREKLEREVVSIDNEPDSEDCDFVILDDEDEDDPQPEPIDENSFLDSLSKKIDFELGIEDDG